MSDEFDSLDASEKDAKRPSDDVVQTAPGSVDIRKAAFAQTSQAFAFAGGRISRCRAAMPPEQEKTDDHDGASVLAEVHHDHKFRALDPISAPTKDTRSLAHYLGHRNLQSTPDIQR
jgi:hypothetical protein